jgi:hypothetical protein
MARSVRMIGVASCLVLLAGVTALPGSCVAAAGPPPPGDAVEAYVERRSYAPGEVAGVRIGAHRQRLVADVIQIGPEWKHTERPDVLSGVQVIESFPVGPGQRRVRLPVGDWASGMYAVRLWGAGRIGYAPFVVRPARLGEQRVAVVMPTNTWQAYNFRDADGDGTGDTWYADRERITTVDLSRPFLHDGVPPKFRHYDVGFLRWLDATGNAADFLAEDDLHRGPSGDRLARLYDLVVFPGHTEYVTAREYAVIERFRDLGGNLAFLSANNFVYRVLRRGDRMVKDRQWRELGRPEAALVGIQYLDWNENRYRNRPYVVRGARSARWFFRGTGLRNGSRFGRYGIEIDNRTPDSPPGTQLLAALPNIFGPGRSGEMTLYRTRRGAKVFAAGSMNFGGSAMWPVSARLLDNLWAHLVRP